MIGWALRGLLRLRRVAFRFLLAVMANPFNPLAWFQASQDWFSKTERSSGFRPYLIFLILAWSAGGGLVAYEPCRFVGQLFLIIPLLVFVVIYAIKAFSDPDFCRSEKHVETLRHIEMEQFGTESQQFDARQLETQLRSGRERALLVSPADGDAEA